VRVNALLTWRYSLLTMSSRPDGLAPMENPIMTTREQDECRGHIEALEDELKLIPYSPWHAVKRADRERQLAFFKRELKRLEATPDKTT